MDSIRHGSISRFIFGICRIGEITITDFIIQIIHGVYNRRIHGVSVFILVQQSFMNVCNIAKIRCRCYIVNNNGISSSITVPINFNQRNLAVLNRELSAFYVRGRADIGSNVLFISRYGRRYICHRVLQQIDVNCRTAVTVNISVRYIRNRRSARMTFRQIRIHQLNYCRIYVSVFRTIFNSKRIYLCQLFRTGNITNRKLVSSRIGSSKALSINIVNCTNRSRSRICLIKCCVGKYVLLAYRLACIRDRPVALIVITISIGCYYQIIFCSYDVPNSIRCNQAVDRNIIRIFAVPVCTCQRDLPFLGRLVLVIQGIVMDLTCQRYRTLILLAQRNRSVIFDRAARNHVAFYSADPRPEVGYACIHFRQFCSAGYVVDNSRVPCRIRYGVSITAILVAFLVNWIFQSRVREYLFAFRLARIRDRPAAFITGCHFQVIASGNLVAQGIRCYQPVDRNIIRIFAVPVCTCQRDLPFLGRLVLVVQGVVMKLTRQRNTRIVIFALF